VRALCLWTALHVLSRSFAAVEPGYSIQIFQTEQGLPQNNINSIIQSRDGYLWLATFGGLVRFDGVRFKVFDSANTPELQNSRITALYEDASGVIWIGHETGDLTRLNGGRFEPAPISGLPRREPILAITADEQGTPMVTYQNATLRNIQTGALIDTDVSSDQQRGITSVVRDGSGAIWILRGGSLCRVVNGKSEAVELDRFAADRQVLGIGAARDGGVWIATPGLPARIRKYRGDQLVEQISPLPWRQTLIPAMIETRDGVLAVATTDQGIIMFRPNVSGAFRVDRTDGLPPDWVRSMCEDREGNIWAGFGAGGMAALRPARATRIKSTDRWQGRPLLGVASTHDDVIWAGTEGAGLYRYNYVDFVPYVSEQGPSTNATIWSLAEQNGERLWISSEDNGLFVLNRNRFQAPVGLEEFSAPARALFQSASQNRMLIGARSGLFQYDNQKIEALATNLVLCDVRCIAEQTNGAIWFGMFGGGLGKLENGKATQFRKGDGLASDFIQCLFFDATDDALWIGSAESGLARYKDGRFSSITTAHGLRDNAISHIADDGRGFFWMSSHAGIMRVAKADLNRCADGALGSFQCLSLAETDGLPSAQSAGGVQPTGCRTSDGLLWFATLKGIVAIDPAHVRTNQLPLVLVEEFRVNDAPVVKSAARINVAPGRRRFDFDYTAISFAAPDRVLFKYRLEGLDPEWIGPTGKRTISYSHIPPGDYTFRVIASNSDGAWNQSNATLAFTVLPFFWQTLWFRVLAIFIAFGMVGLAALLVTRQRYRRRIELAERQRGIERERARIAQDIHDDLGSSLTRIILLSQSARGDLDSPEVAASDLDRIYDTARNLTRSLDEIVWAVNPRHDTLDSLATYLGKFAQDFLGAANIRCRLDLPVSLPSWPLSAETRHNVFLAFKEALNNTVKHAQATEVRVSLTLEPAAFTLTVEDNGRGFTLSATPAQATDTEDGLQNMRKRLSEIGGRCEIFSEPGKGARVSFGIPIKAREVSSTVA
jgi:signal transduction histidine kinase/ligand-binding sensor domain-containing protein